MSTMNKLLADIVVASGGTVRNKHNRNMLLEDWLSAVESPPTIYAPRFNGLSQYMQFSPASFAGEFEVRVKFSSTIDSFKPVISGPTVNDFARTLTGSGFQISIAGNYGAGFDDGQNYNDGVVRELCLKRDSSDVVTVMIDNIVKNTATITGTFTVDRLGRSWAAAVYIAGLMYDYSDSSGNIFKMNDKDSDPVAVNSGTGSDGTYINSTAAMWEII